MVKLQKSQNLSKKTISNDKKIIKEPKERYTSPKQRHKIIDDSRLI